MGGIVLVGLVVVFVVLCRMAHNLERDLSGIFGDPEKTVERRSRIKRGARRAPLSF